MATPVLNKPVEDARGHQIAQSNPRRYATREHTEYAFGELRRALACDTPGRDCGIECQVPNKPQQNSIVATLMDFIA